MKRTVLVFVSIFLLAVPVWKSNVQAQVNPGYLIISSTGSANLDVLIKYRKSQGYDVTVKDASEFKDSNDKVSSELILKYLKQNVTKQNIKYLLLVGYAYELPMVTCHPEGAVSTDQYLVSTPTDYPYSTPSATWDKDNDGKLGEWPDDGIASFKPEISVGRLPFSDPKKLITACRSIVEFDQLSDAQKAKILFGGAMLGYKGELWENKPMERTDGGYYCETVWNDAFAGKGFSRYRMYEKEGFLPSPYDCEEGLTSSSLLDKIPDRYGLVLWTGHGSSESVVRTVWNSNGTKTVPEKGETNQPKLITTNNVSSSTVRWGIVVAASCSTSDPSNTGNLGATFLSSGAAGYVGSSRVSWSPSYWRKPTDGGMDTILYSFCKNLSTPGMDQGMALALAKQEFGEKYFYGDTEDPVAASQMNLYNFNLFGDPAVKLVSGDESPKLWVEEPSISAPPSSEVVWNGTLSGNFNEKVQLQVLPSQRDMTWALPEIAIDGKTWTVKAKINADVDLGKRTWFIREVTPVGTSMIPLILNITGLPEAKVETKTIPCKVGKKMPFEMQFSIGSDLKVYEFILKYDPFEVSLTGVTHLKKIFSKMEIIDNHFGMAFIRAEGVFKGDLIKVAFKAKSEFTGKPIFISSIRAQTGSSFLLMYPQYAPIVYDEKAEWRLQADFNNSGTVDGTDLGMLLQYLGKKAVGRLKSFDLNKDGVISILDVSEVKIRFSKDC